MTRAAACAASVARTSGLLARRTGRRHAARGLPEVRRRGRLRAVGGTGQPVHQGFRGGVRVADDGREPEDGQRFPSCVVEDRRHRRPSGVLLQCLFDRFGSVFPQCGLMVFPGVVIVSR